MKLRNLAAPDACQSAEFECLLSAEGCYLFVSASATGLLGYKPEELIGKQQLTFLHPDDTTTSSMEELFLLRQESFHTTYRHRTKSGAYLRLLDLCKAVKDENGKVYAYTSRLISGPAGELQAEQAMLSTLNRPDYALAEKDQIYRSLFEHHPDSAFVIDTRGTILKTNKSSLDIEITGENSLEGKNFLTFLEEADKSIISSALPDLLSGRSIQLETRLEKIKKPADVLLTLVPIKEMNKLTGFFIKLRNISEQKRQEKEIRLLNQTSLSLSNAPSLEYGMTEVLGILCEFTGFEYADFWMPLFGQEKTRLKSQWSKDASFCSFADASRCLTLDLTTNIPSFFRQGQPHYCGDLSQDFILNRKSLAQKSGIQSYLAIPLLYRHNCLGGILLFSRQRNPPLLLEPVKLQGILSKLGGEIERRQTGEELDRFFTLSPDLLLILGYDGHIKKINPAFGRLLGYTYEEILPFHILDLVHPDDIDKASREWQELITITHTRTNENRYRCKDGSYRWIASTEQTVPEENLVYIIARDVTEQKKQIEEIEQIKTAIENTSDAIGIGRSLEECIYTNKTFEKSLGLNSRIINQQGGTISLFSDQAMARNIYQILNAEGRWQGDVKIIDHQGQVLDFNLRCNVVLDESGAFKYFIGIFTDIGEQKKARHEINKLSKAVDESSNEVYIFDGRTFKFSYANRRGLENLGYSLEELKELTPPDVNPDLNPETGIEFIRPLLEGKSRSLSIQSLHQRKDGSQYPLEAHLSLFDFENSISVMVQVIDITERIKTEEALRITNERYHLVTKATHDAIWDLDLISSKMFWGEGYYSLFGTKPTETPGFESWQRNIHPDDAKHAIERIFDVLHSGKNQWVNEYRFKCTDGNYKYVRDRAYVIYDGTGKAIRMTGAMTDITEQKRNEKLLREFNAELELKVSEKTARLQKVLSLMNGEIQARMQTEGHLQQSLKEKEILLKEIHHRVKNNMAIISGLLSLQARQIKEAEVKELFSDSQARIKSMALVHEHLYQHLNLASINFQDYIRELAEGIKDSFSEPERRIEMELELEDTELDITYAVPCGLILNELITNCYKYAFKGREKGLIRIKFKRSGDTFILKVADDGIGVSEKSLKYPSKSLGMQLVKSLVKQMGGSLEINSLKGAEFIITFTLNLQA